VPEPCAVHSSPVVPTTPVNAGSITHNAGNNLLPVSAPNSPYTFQTCLVTAPPPVDPLWAAFGAGSQSFVQMPITPTAVHALCAQCLASLAAIIPMTLEGATWISYHVNPNHALPFNKSTNNIPSWYGMHPVYRWCESFLVTLAHIVINKELFLACCCSPWEYKQYNHFVSQFPQFNCDSISNQMILKYYHCIVDYAHPHGVFVPPLCTLCPGYKFGIWLSELLPHIQHEVETMYTGLIATGLSTCLTSVLAKHHILAGIISNTSDGYEPLLLMAQFAGHPEHKYFYSS